MRYDGDFIGCFNPHHSDKQVMQHTFLHTIETCDTETTLTITYQHTPPSRGQTGPHGEPLEPDAESEIEILCVTDETGNECDPETIENINVIPLCWDHLAKTFKP